MVLGLKGVKQYGVETLGTIRNWLYGSMVRECCSQFHRYNSNMTTTLIFLFNRNK